jgi:hypothetical protein
MKQIGDFIGGIISLFFLGAIVFGAFSSGESGPIIFVLVIGLVIYLVVKRENRRIKQNEEASMKMAKIENEEKLRRQKIEEMSEAAFIDFVKSNYRKLDKFLNIDSSGFNGIIDIKKWSTKQYSVVSEYNTDECSEMLLIYRKSDKQEIFCGIRE